MPPNASRIIKTYTDHSVTSPCLYLTTKKMPRHSISSNSRKIQSVLDWINDLGPRTEDERTIPELTIQEPDEQEVSTAEEEEGEPSSEKSTQSLVSVTKSQFSAGWGIQH